VAHPLIELLAPSPVILLLAVALDLALGDPVYRWHPVRIIGSLLTAIETRLRRHGWDGYGGGIVLFLVLALVSIAACVLTLALAGRISSWAAWAVHVALLYSLLALGDLVRHVSRIERALAAGDLIAARAAAALLVGRDTAMLDPAACRRAGIESLSESLTDGFVSPVFWYAMAGLPGVILFKVVSTMDSMVGYKTPQYARFGWCGARLDDVMNYVPARLTWLLIAVAAVVVPGCSAARAFTVGWRQHATLPGPNAGWSEAATAGAIARRLVGPIYRNGQLVTDTWIGESSDPPAATTGDIRRSITLTTTAEMLAVVLAIAAVPALHSQ
jgi:adenosylcobinamide-phosphate synthase